MCVTSISLQEKICCKNCSWPTASRNNALGICIHPGAMSGQHQPMTGHLGKQGVSTFAHHNSPLTSHLCSGALCWAGQELPRVALQSTALFNPLFPSLFSNTCQTCIVAYLHLLLFSLSSTEIPPIELLVLLTLSWCLLPERHDLTQMVINII